MARRRRREPERPVLPDVLTPPCYVEDLEPDASLDAETREFRATLALITARARWFRQAGMMDDDGLPPRPVWRQARG